MLARVVSNALVLLGLWCITLPSWAINQAEYDQAVASWAQVLSRFVDEHGQTDFAALAKQTGDLNTYVDFIAKVSPSKQPFLFPTTADVLAYHINSYNALAMHGVIEQGIPKDFDSFFKRLRFFKLRNVEIGGQITSLYDYENEVIRPLGEPRIHFSLNCMVKDCPRLPREVFTAKDLEQVLDRLTHEFFNKPKHLRVDKEARRVYVSEILDFYTEDFVSSGDQQDLLSYINQYRSVAIPNDYQLEFIDYDWTINQQP